MGRFDPDLCAPALRDTRRARRPPTAPATARRCPGRLKQTLPTSIATLFTPPTFLLTSVPVAAGGEVVLLADRPAEAARVPEDVPVLGGVLEHRPLGRPLHELVGHELVPAVAVRVGRPEHVDRGADN